MSSGRRSNSAAVASIDQQQAESIDQLKAKLVTIEREREARQAPDSPHSPPTHSSPSVKR